MHFFFIFNIFSFLVKMFIDVQLFGFSFVYIII